MALFEEALVEEITGGGKSSGKTQAAEEIRKSLPEALREQGNEKLAREVEEYRVLEDARRASRRQKRKAARASRRKNRRG